MLLLCGWAVFSLSVYAEDGSAIWLGAGNSTQFRDQGTKLDYSVQLLAEARSNQGLQAGIGIERLQLENRGLGDDMITLYLGARVPNWSVAPYANIGAGWYGGEFLDLLEPIFGDCIETKNIRDGQGEREESSIDESCDSDVFLQYAEAGLEIALNEKFALRAYARRNRFDTLQDKYMSSAGVRLGYLF